MFFDPFNVSRLRESELDSHFRYFARNEVDPYRNFSCVDDSLFF